MSKKYFCGFGGSNFVNGEIVKVPCEIAHSFSLVIHFNFTVCRNDIKSNWILSYHNVEDQKIEIDIFPSEIDQVCLTSTFLYGLELSKQTHIVDLNSLISSNAKLVFRVYKTAPAPGIKLIVANEKNEVYGISECEFFNLENGKFNLIHLFETEQLKKIASGFDHVGILTQSGRVYVWGNGSRGQLGTRNVNNIKIPQVLEIFEGLDTSVEDICCGGWHSMCRTKSGDVYSWGWRESGQVGHFETEPFPLEIPHKVVSISAGARHSMAVTENGEIYGWGNNNYGQIGNENLLENIQTPEKIKSIEFKCKQVECGHWHTILTWDNF